MATAEQNKTEKRVRLLDSALSLFSSKGMKTPTVDEVVKLAGVAKGTFYLYFHDKYDLMDQLFLRKFAECIKSASETVRRKLEKKDVTDVEHLCAFLDTVLDSLAGNKEFLPLIKKKFTDDRIAAGLVPVQMILDDRASKIISGTPADENSFDTEFLDYKMAFCIVDTVDEAIKHILLHSTGHSEAIITENRENAERFCSATDSAAVYVNASTRFTDGGEFGLGCEIGISTQKMHARGPVGLCELNTYKYIVYGNGNIR